MPVLIAGTQSGCGKSTVTLAILAALRGRGLEVQSFKSGPDFIDPGVHGLATGRRGRNLDLWICGPEYVRGLLMRASAGMDAAVIEGVMGYYDGGDRSTAALAREVDAKVILVIDAFGMAETAGAILRGFREYGGPIHGVIYNRVGSASHYDRLRAASDGVECLGYLPRGTEYTIPERHLGLVVAEEGPIGEAALASLRAAAEAHLDMVRIAALARPVEGKEAALLAPASMRTRIGIARDKAFSFYYEDNIELLREHGAEPVYFSPLEDTRLPDGIGAVYIGGGYPEMHASQLEANRAMRASIREFAALGMPVYGECGGLMYLGQGITREERRYEMAGVLPIETKMSARRAGLGYREAVLSTDCILGRRGSIIRGHEFHYSVIASAGQAEGVCYNVLGEQGPAITSVMAGSVLGSYIHLHFGSCPDAARSFAGEASSAAGPGQGA